MPEEKPTTAVEKAQLRQAEAEMGRELLLALVEEIRNLRTHWAVTPKQQQEEVIERLESAVQVATHRAVAIVARGNFPVVNAHVESVTFKDGVKAVLTMSKTDAAVHDLAESTGSAALVVLTDSERYFEKMRTVRGDDDQKSLPGLAA